MVLPVHHDSLRRSMPTAPASERSLCRFLRAALRHMLGGAAAADTARVVPSPRPRGGFRSTVFFLSPWLVAGLLMAEEPPRSDASDTPRPGVVRTPLPPDESGGLPLALVFLDLKGASGITGGDQEARRQIERSLGLSVGTPFSVTTTEVALQRVRALDFIRSASFQLFDSDRPGHVVLSISIVLGPRDRAAGPKGMLAGHQGDFPILYQDERSLLRVQLDLGLGAYTDFNPWFADTAAFTSRSPIAQDPASGASATWFEASAEYGLAGITRLGDSPVWAYAAGTFLTSFSSGQDLFRSDTREMTRLEDLYAGFVVGSPNSNWSASLSAGRQNWQLHDGFLFSRFAAGANAGPYPALYLNPRTAYEMTVLGQLKWKKLRLEGFYLDPAEIDFLDSQSTYAGATLAYASPRGTEAALLYYESPESNTVFPAGAFAPVPRQGLQTFDGRIGSSNFFAIQGLEMFGEYAWQSHRDVAWDARAYYVRAGYTFTRFPWAPNLGYRYAHFSGDDPETRTYERFDAPLSSGLDTWVQGISSKKVVSNSNLNSHRLRLNLAPTQTFSITLDYFWLHAHQATSSSAYAQELNLGIRWAVTRNLYFLGVAGIAFPGEALRQQAGGDLDNWSTVQASVFINF